MIKKISLLLLIILLSVLEISATVYSGSCGKYARYSLNTETGVLSITGTGAMIDYVDYEVIPWYSCRSYINTVNIADGVTSIGDYVFYKCDSLTSVSIGSGVTSIKGSAFYKCSQLTSVDIKDIAAWCNIKFSDDYANPLCYAHQNIQTPECRYK